MIKWRFNRLNKAEQKKHITWAHATFQPGSLCIISEATGLAACRMYRVIKHFAPGEREKVIRMRGVGPRFDKIKRKPSEDYETQVEPVFEFNLKGKSASGKTTFETCRLEQIDLIALGTLYQKLSMIANELCSPGDSEPGSPDMKE